MKTIQIRNINDIEANVMNRGEGNVFSVKAASDGDLLTKSHASFVEVEPGNTAFGYHYHEVNEEIFYIISGEGTVETPDGERPIKAGDILSFPTGKGGAHVVKNTSTEKLVYLDFGTRSDVEIAHLVKANKMMIISKDTFALVDETENTK